MLNSHKPDFEAHLSLSVCIIYAPVVEIIAISATNLICPGSSHIMGKLIQSKSVM
jgi:hypothetical protein